MEMDRVSTCWRSAEYLLLEGANGEGVLLIVYVSLRPGTSKQTWAALRRESAQTVRNIRLLPLLYWRSFRSAWGAALAWARAATEDCSRICALVRLAASVATSASRIADWAAEKLEI